MAVYSQVGGVMGVFFTALVLAEKECAVEIRVDHLLATLDMAPTEEKLMPPSAGPLLPCPKREMLFSSEAEAVIESVGVSKGRQ